MPDEDTINTTTNETVIDETVGETVAEDTTETPAVETETNSDVATPKVDAELKATMVAAILEANQIALKEQAESFKNQCGQTAPSSNNESTINIRKIDNGFVVSDYSKPAVNGRFFGGLDEAIVVAGQMLGDSLRG